MTPKSRGSATSRDTWGYIIKLCRWDLSALSEGALVAARIIPMNSALKAVKKGFTMSVVVTTILWSMGVAALAPLAAQAVECPALQVGSQFKVAGDPAVYILNQNLQPLFFPNANVYKSWFADYSGVVTIDPSCFDNYTMPTAAPYGVNFRPGTLVKLQASNSVYVVESGNKIRRIASEAAAAMLAGSNWNRKVYDVHPAFWANFSVVAGDSTGMPVNGMLVKLASSSAVYMVEGGMLRMVDGGVPSFLSGYVATVPQSTFNSFGTGSNVMRADLSMDPTQGAGSGSVNPNPTPNPTPGPTPTGGALSVGLSANTPVGTTLSNSTAYNEVLKINLMANSAPVRVSGITVRKTGLVANSKISGVSAWVDGMRLGDVMSSFNSEDKVTINFGVDAVTIPAGSSKVLTVAMNLASDATGGTVGANIALASDIISNGTVSGAFPIIGNTFGLTDGDDALSTVTLTGQSVGGLGTEPSSGTAGNVEIAEVKDLLKIRISETSGNNDVHLKNIRVYFQGSLQDRDVTDLELRAPDNTVLGTATQITDRYVSFNIANGYTIPEGSNRVVTLRGKINDGSGNYFRAQVQNDYDILLQDASTGFYVLPASFLAVSSSDGWFKMKSGSASVSKRNDSPSTRVSAGATDRVLARYDLKAVGEDLEIRKAALRVATSSFAGAAGLTGNVRVVVDGVTVLTVSAGSSLYNSATQYNLSQYINIASGETKVVEVIGNIPTTATGTATYTVSFGNLYAKRLSTNDFSDLATSVVAGNTLTADTTSLTLSKDTALGNRTASLGSKIEVGRFVVRAGDAEAVSITNATVSFNGGGAFSAPTYLKNLELRDANNNALGSTLSTVATSSNSFSFSLALAANEQKVIKVWSDTESTSSGTTSVSFAVTYVGQSTSNSDTATAVTGQTITFGAANVVIAASNDSTTISSIRTPSAAPMQLGKWSIKAENETVNIERLTFQVVDDTLASDTSAGNFGTLYLYDSNNMSTPIGSASYTPGSSAGYVRFTGLNYSVGADETKYIVLKGEINGSGTMDVASINAFAIRSNNDTNDVRIVAASGGELGLAQIDSTTSGANTTSVRFATSSFYLFHNTAPVIASVNIGSTLEQSSQAKIFQFSITNSGDREMRISTTTINVAASGLTANGTATGTIGTWQLWEANSSGGLGTQIAATSTASLAGGIGITNGVNASAGNTLNVVFGQSNDTNSLLDNFTIPVGSSRTLILVADTTAMFNGKASGVGQITVSVSPKLDGATGYDASADEFEDNWANGVVEYYYTPVNGSVNSEAYVASDSYDVVGTSLSRQG